MHAFSRKIAEEGKGEQKAEQQKRDARHRSVVKGRGLTTTTRTGLGGNPLALYFGLVRFQEQPEGLTASSAHPI
jgi:hypothetical protein